MREREQVINDNKNKRGTRRNKRQVMRHHQVSTNEYHLM